VCDAVYFTDRGTVDRGFHKEQENCCHVPMMLSIRANRLANPNDTLKSLLHHSSDSSLFPISHRTPSPILSETHSLVRRCPSHQACSRSHRHRHCCFRCPRLQVLSRVRAVPCVLGRWMRRSPWLGGISIMLTEVLRHHSLC
jgi:hypothetical protein